MPFGNDADGGGAAATGGPAGGAESLRRRPGRGRLSRALRARPRLSLRSVLTASFLPKEHVQTTMADSVTFDHSSGECVERFVIGSTVDRLCRAYRAGRDGVPWERLATLRCLDGCTRLSKVCSACDAQVSLVFFFFVFLSFNLCP